MAIYVVAALIDLVGIVKPFCHCGAETLRLTGAIAFLIVAVAAIPLTIWLWVRRWRFAYLIPIGVWGVGLSWAVITRFMVEDPTN